MTSTHCQKIIDKQTDPLHPCIVAPIDLGRVPAQRGPVPPEEGQSLVFPVAQGCGGPLALARLVVGRLDGLVGHKGAGARAPLAPFAL